MMIYAVSVDVIVVVVVVVVAVALVPVVVQPGAKWGCLLLLMMDV